MVLYPDKNAWKIRLVLDVHDVSSDFHRGIQLQPVLGNEFAAAVDWLAS